MAEAVKGTLAKVRASLEGFEALNTLEGMCSVGQ